MGSQTAKVGRSDHPPATLIDIFTLTEEAKMARIIIYALLLAFVIWQVDAFCCNWTLTSNMKAQCADGSYVHPWQCCTTGSCNVFCCNCDKPCLRNDTISATP